MDLLVPRAKRIHDVKQQRLHDSSDNEHASDDGARSDQELAPLVIADCVPDFDGGQFVPEEYGGCAHLGEQRLGGLVLEAFVGARLGGGFVEEVDLVDVEVVVGEELALVQVLALLDPRAVQVEGHLLGVLGLDVRDLVDVAKGQVVHRVRKVQAFALHVQHVYYLTKCMS